MIPLVSVELGNDRLQRDKDTVNWERAKMADTWKRNPHGFEQ
jgi:hypothetical protein